VSGFLPELRHLQAVVLATLDESGMLVDANAGFMRIIGAEGQLAHGFQAAGFFIQPRFSTLLGISAEPSGTLYQGLLTLGEYMGVTRSLRGCVTRQGNQIVLLAEYDIDELERLNQSVLQLNQNYANAQLELAQTNFKLHQHKVLLEQTVAKLSAANTDLKQAQSRLLQSDKLASIGLLAAGVAHEINNPVSFVSSNLGALKRYVDDLLALISAYESAELYDVAEWPAAFAAVGRVKAEIGLAFLKTDVILLLAESHDGLGRVKKIVKSLKDFSRIDSSETWLQADIRQGIESTLHVVSNELRYRCEVVSEYGELPLVECVPSQLNQVFMNLLVNAAQSIDDHGLVTIRTGCQGAEVWVEIADTGCGIPAKNLPQIFDPFFTTKPIGKGTGLGLSVSYGIVESHHGRIEVSSEIGKGSIFRVCLPITREHTPLVDDAGKVQEQNGQ
jgi:signal transduction histidine kinase